jgi:cell wall-associated NlpC family hydrolase
MRAFTAPLAACAAGLLSLLGAACATTGGAVPHPFPQPAVRSAPSSPASPWAATVRALVDTALALRGAPYLNGGSDPRGFDCSGFTQYVFSRSGIPLPRDVHEQFAEGSSIRPRDIVAGDLLFFQTVGAGATHVGIAIDADRFVHAPSSRGVVRVERRSSPYWATRFVGARRVTKR